MKKWGLVLILTCLIIGVSGCSSSSTDLEEQVSDIDAYNKSVENIANNYDKIKKSGDDLCGDIKVFVTTNVISDKLYSYLELSGSLPTKESGESDTAYKSRCADVIFDGNTVLDAYNEWKDDENTFDWIFDGAYVWRNSYYVSVASEYTRQFTVIKATGSNATAIVNSFWKDGKIHKIIVSHYT